MPHDWLTSPAGGVPSVRRRSWPCAADRLAGTCSASLIVWNLLSHDWDPRRQTPSSGLHPSSKQEGCRKARLWVCLRNVTTSQACCSQSYRSLSGQSAAGRPRTKRHYRFARNLQTMSVQFPAPALGHFSSKNQFSIVCLGHCLCSTRLTWLSDWNTKISGSDRYQLLPQKAAFWCRWPGCWIRSKY